LSGGSAANAAAARLKASALDVANVPVVFRKRRRVGLWRMSVTLTTFDLLCVGAAARCSGAGVGHCQLCQSYDACAQ
jgi:hypothetical protein